MLRELLARPGVTEVLHLRGTVGLLAFHGGALERVTDIVAAEVAELAGASYYGVLHPDDAPHLPSTAFDPADSAALAAFLSHIDVAIAVRSTLVTEGTPSTSRLTFTPNNWNAPQTVTVTGADDMVVE